MFSRQRRGTAIMLADEEIEVMLSASAAFGGGEGANKPLCGDTANGPGTDRQGEKRFGRLSVLTCSAGVAAHPAP